MKKVCMIVQDRKVKGGIAAVISGYYGSKLEEDFNMVYVESYKDGGKVSKLIKSICGYIHFLKVLLIDKPDIVHIHSSFGPSFYRKIPFIYMASFFNKPIINHIHGADFNKFYNGASKNKKRLIQKIYNKCSIIVVLSDEWKEKLKYVVEESKIYIVQNYSLAYEDVLLEKKNRSLNYQVLFLGEIGARKGCYDIPNVIKNVAEVIPNVKFILAGSGDIDELRKLSRKYEIEDNIVFPGWVRGDKKDEILKQSDIFFLPSYNEGMPMAILDAMGYGLPIISTNVGGIPKIVRQGKNGYLFEAGDIESFSKKIIELLNSKNKIEEYGEESFKIVKEEYSLESHINMITKLYNMNI